MLEDEKESNAEETVLEHVLKSNQVRERLLKEDQREKESLNDNASILSILTIHMQSYPKLSKVKIKLLPLAYPAS